ncbi:ribonuclease III [Thalassoglobus polymorphus]|uniref:Ribonuclease 3 n=1 Tax=Thalassoglobus polymorphus TaxID=2527994 RepID=A0A517QKC4_9PLAN|nr:ribonuclease III [Thalassoglobus polymorphus]QDT32081.1 Ribonuclease 3 [Thalassoglobus polymorphus]
MSQTSVPDGLTPEQLQECQAILGYEFKDPDILILSLTHASASRVRLESNERLEFLGDAILGAAVCESLFQRFPEASEGELTRIKSVVVSRATCARIVRQWRLHDYLILGKGITMSSHIPNSVLATVFEAIIGGIYLDRGFDAAKSFIQRIIDQEITQAADSEVGVNYKSILQQRIQKLSGETPVYEVLDEEGPDHSKSFQIAVIVGADNFSPAWGPSKKIAEQRAAQNALSKMNGEDPPNSAELTKNR